MGSWIELSASDGHEFKAYEARPSGAPRGAVVILPEIFGINSHIRSVADGYAADGYVAVAPALYDRAVRNYETGYSPDDIKAGMAVRANVGDDKAMLDVTATIDYLQPVGGVAVVGYCWGGTLAWLAAARGSGLKAAVAYYGGGVFEAIGEQPEVPTMLHFAELDQHPTLAQAKEVAAAHPDALSYFYAGAGHGFNCDQRGSYNAEASATARQRTLEFLAKHLG